MNHNQSGGTFPNPRVVPYDYRKNSTTEYKRFNNEYFSGADVRIYFGDMWIDEITGLEFTLQENVAPIFGYASYTYDKVARGNRMIQGSLSINFKESYYLHSIMNRLQSKLERETKSNPAFQSETFKKGLDVEHLITQAAGRDFDLIADEFEKSLWGEEDIERIGEARDNREEGGYFYNHKTHPELNNEGFNIVITYGPYNQKDGITVAGSVVTITGVHLTSCNQMIGGDGNPIQEMYQFVAKDLNADVTQ